jgi:hypothetical protein
MSTMRDGVSVAVIDDRLYAIGGRDGQRYLNTIDR